MRLLNPLGLLGLIGVPLLIWLYIIRQKHVKRNISSSFIWRKSKLGTRKIKWQRFKNYLLIVLQLLTVIVVSFLLSKPALKDDGKGKDIAVIIDGSASMLAKTDGTSRYEKAIKKITNVAKNMDSGSKMTVIQAGDNASYIIKNSDSANDIKFALEKSKCSYGESDIKSALELAGKSEILLYTDRDYEQTGNITVSNCSKDESNCAVTGITASNENGEYVFTTSIISYGKDESITMALNIDGNMTDAKTVDCEDGVIKSCVWDNLGIKAYKSAQLVIDNEDAIDEDNTYTLFNNGDEKKVLILSDSSMFIRKALRAAGNVDISYDKTEEQFLSREEGNSVSGYDLYIFDGLLPTDMPQDGAVWLINQPKDALGISILGTKKGSTLELGEDTQSDMYSSLTTDVTAKEIDIAEYSCVKSYDGYETILRCGKDPIVLARTSDNYEKTIAYMFDIHNSNMPLMKDFPILISNMLNYTLKSVISANDYNAGETIEINMQRNSDLVYVNSDKIGDITDGKAMYIAKTPGEYNITQKAGDNDITASCYVHIPAKESIMKQGSVSLGLGDSSESLTRMKASIIPGWMYGRMGIPTLISIALLIILISEWWVYYNEEF